MRNYYYDRPVTMPIEKTVPTGLARAIYLGGSLVTARREPTPKAKNSHALANFSTFSAALASGYSLLDDGDRDEGIDPERGVYRAADGVYLQTKPNLDGCRDADTADDDFFLRAELFGLENAWHDDDYAGATNSSLTEISADEWQPPVAAEPDDRYAKMATDAGVADVAYTDTARDTVAVQANAKAAAEFSVAAREAAKFSQRRGAAPRLQHYFTTNQVVGIAAGKAYAAKREWDSLLECERRELLAKQSPLPRARRRQASVEPLTARPRRNARIVTL